MATSQLTPEDLFTWAKCGILSAKQDVADIESLYSQHGLAWILQAIEHWTQGYGLDVVLEGESKRFRTLVLMHKEPFARGVAELVEKKVRMQLASSEEDEGGVADDGT